MHKLIALLLFSISCGIVAPATSPRTTQARAIPATHTTEPYRLCVLVDTLTLRHAPSEQSPAYDGLELHKGDKVLATKPLWIGDDLWYELSPVEFVAGYVDGQPLIGACD